MRLVRISSETVVNPDFVQSVTVNDAYGTITVRMHDGTEHHLNRDYGKGAYETHDRIVKALEAAK